MRSIARYFANAGGASAAEFALVVVPFFALIFSIIWMGLLLYSDSQLQQATEAASRCWSVGAASGGASQCDGSSSTALTYAQAQYKGMGTPIFTVPTLPGSGCGHQINGNLSFPLNVIVYSTTVALTSSACFP